MKTFLRLLGSELERFAARRMARVLLIIAVGIGVLVGTITFLVTDEHSAPDSAAVQHRLLSVCVSVCVLVRENYIKSLSRFINILSEKKLCLEKSDT